MTVVSWPNSRRYSAMKNFSTLKDKNTFSIYIPLSFSQPDIFVYYHDIHADKKKYCFVCVLHLLFSDFFSCCLVRIHLPVKRC